MKTKRSAEEIGEERIGETNVDVVGSYIYQYMNGRRRLWYHRRLRSLQGLDRLKYVKASWVVGSKNRIYFIFVYEPRSSPFR